MEGDFLARSKYVLKNKGSVKKRTIFKNNLQRFEKLAAINHQLAVRIKFRNYS